MSAFGDGDPRTEIYDWIRVVQQQHRLTEAQTVAAALEALAYFAEELKRG